MKILSNPKASNYESPSVIIIQLPDDIITESAAHDPNQGEWDTD